MSWVDVIQLCEERQSSPQQRQPMNKLPLYKQVKNNIVQSLVDGEWHPGNIMPSEPQMAQRYGVGINTIRAAISELVAANILFRHQGKGTFVSKHATSQGIYRFFNVVRADGQRELPVRQLLSLQVGLADKKTADFLQLTKRRKDAKIYTLLILSRLGGRPVGISRITLPFSLFGALSEQKFEDGSVSLYGLYEATYGVSVIRIREMVSAAKARAKTAEALRVPVGDPVLEIRRTAYSFNDRPVELRLTHVDTRHYRYLIDQGAEL